MPIDLLEEVTLAMRSNEDINNSIDNSTLLLKSSLAKRATLVSHVRSSSISRIGHAL